MIAKVASLALGIVTLLLVPACDDSVDSAAEDTETHEFAASVTKLEASTFNGPITVRADATAPKVGVVVTKRGTGKNTGVAENDLANIKVDAKESGGIARVTVTYARSAPGKSQAAIEVALPPNVALDVTTTNGDIRVSGAEGGITAETANGLVDAGRARGAVEARSGNGRIEIDGEGVLVTAQTSNGQVQFVGSLAPGGSLLRSSNGDIEATLRKDASLAIDAQTINGRVSSAFDVEGARLDARNSMSGTIGNPGPEPATRLQLYTNNGNITVRREE